MQDSKLLPTQIDLWIIPKGVKSISKPGNNDDSSGDDSTNDENGNDDDDDDNGYTEYKENENIPFDIDIEKRLKYVKDKEILDDIKASKQVFARNLKTGFEGLIKDRNQRLCIILDRKKLGIKKGGSGGGGGGGGGDGDGDKKNKEKGGGKRRKDKNKNKEIDDDEKNKNNDDDNKRNTGDRLFMYHLNNNLNVSKFEKDDKLLSPSLISNTKQCLLPDIKYIGNIKNKKVFKWQHIGSFHGINGYQFTLSFHIYAQSDVRVYLYHDGYMIRFIPTDIINLLPKIFKNGKFKHFKEIKGLVNKILQNKNLSDSRFVKFYESLTGKPLYDQI